MGKYSLMRNPSTNTTSFGKINLTIPTEPQLESTEANIYLFLGFHKGKKGFGLKHIRDMHEREIRALRFINEKGHTLILEYVASIVRPGTKLYYTGESWKKCRLLAWNRTGMAVLEFQENTKYGKHWSIITAYTRRIPYGQEVGTIL